MDTTVRVQVAKEGQMIIMKDDCISRQAAIEINQSYHGQMPNEVNHRIWKEINELPSVQETHEERTETHGVCLDVIDRQAAIDALGYCQTYLFDSRDKDKKISLEDAEYVIEQLPSTQPALCGYNIEYLILIANVLRKENLPPERVVEALTDIGRIVSIVNDEFEESLRRAVEQCKV